VERWLTIGYIAVVLGLGLWSLWPRVFPSIVPVRQVQVAAPSISPLTPGPANLAEVREKVNLNTASQAELESLPRVGPALAERIIAGRPYRNLEDLDKIRGIGPGLLDQLRPLVSF
jgi:competence protein ComEA